MKKIIYIVTLMFACIACEVIPADQQMIPVEMGETNRTTLIVEFSGLKCNNCPLAAEEAHNLLDIYGNKLVVVEMHPASNSLTNGGKKWDYTCPAADEYYKHWNITSLPYGVVNMSQPEAYQSWGAAYQKSAKMISPVELQPNIQIDSTNTLNIDIQICNISNDLLQLQYIAWITEDSIIGGQLMPDGKTQRADYPHNHVLRDALTDLWGTPIEVAAKEATTISLTYTLAEKLVARNCNIVSVVMKDNEAIQVNEYKLKNIIK